MWIYTVMCLRCKFMYLMIEEMCLLLEYLFFVNESMKMDVLKISILVSVILLHKAFSANNLLCAFTAEWGVQFCLKNVFYISKHKYTWCEHAHACRSHRKRVSGTRNWTQTSQVLVQSYAQNPHKKPWKSLSCIRFEVFFSLFWLCH